MPLSEFDCIVLGDDPSGLWLLNQLWQQSHGKLRLAHVSFDKDHTPIPLPTLVGSRFNIAPSISWSPEMLSPKGTKSWDAATVSKLFPLLGHLMAKPDLLDQSGKLMKALAECVRKEPDLIGFGEGLALTFGKAAKISPALSALYAWLYCEVSYWRPHDELPEGVFRFHWNAKDHFVEKLSPRGKLGISLQCRDQDPIVSQWVVFNDSWTKLKQLLKQNDVCDSLGLSFSEDTPPSRALYPVTLSVDPGIIPVSVRPVSVYFDSWEIPDMETEICPVQLIKSEAETKLVVWVPGAKDFSLDHLLADCRNGLGRMNRLFPFLTTAIKHIEPSLDLESCYSQDARQAVIETFESRAVESYHFCWLHSKLRISGVERLGPFMNTHWPFPWGGLIAAKELLGPMAKELLKPILKAEKQAAAAARKSAPPPSR